MRMRPRHLAIGALLCAAALAGAVAPGRSREPAVAARASARPRTPLAVYPAGLPALGKAIFFDATLSARGNQSCGSCHVPEAGWTGPVSSVNAAGAVYQGSVAGRFGNRTPPSAAYASPSPVFHLAHEPDGAVFVGGSFLDGRATGERLGSPVAEQAEGPFVNPVEQALASPSEVVRRVCAGPSAAPFGRVWGPAICRPANEVMAYDAIGLSVAAFVGSPEAEAYSSKFDLVRAGAAEFSPEERRGFDLFRDKGKCAECHTLEEGPDGAPLFTDYTFDNLGLPRNPQNPWYAMPAERNPQGTRWTDPGLGGFLATRPDYRALAGANVGKHKVPTLRNVDRRPFPGFVKAYGHNGYFKTLEGFVHFYNTRDVKPVCPGALTEAEALAAGCWPPPEVVANVNRDELGDLGLTPVDELAIVAFLRTLSDGYRP
jgi:cytochrome c peroxidase